MGTTIVVRSPQYTKEQYERVVEETPELGETIKRSAYLVLVKRFSQSEAARREGVSRQMVAKCVRQFQALAFRIFEKERYGEEPHEKLELIIPSYMKRDIRRALSKITHSRS